MQKKVESNQVRIEKVRKFESNWIECKELCTTFESNRDKIQIIAQKVRFKLVKYSESNLTVTVQNGRVAEHEIV